MTTSRKIVSGTRPANIQCANTKTIVPTHAHSKDHGDVLITLSPANWPCVIDVCVPHPYPGSGEYKLNTVLEAQKSMCSHGQACVFQGYYYLTAIGSTDERQHEDLVRLQFHVANQAEYVVKYLQPHKTFKSLVGDCFAGIKRCIGAAFTRPLS